MDFIPFFYLEYDQADGRKAAHILSIDDMINIVRMCKKINFRHVLTVCAEFLSDLQVLTKQEMQVYREIYSKKYQRRRTSSSIGEEGKGHVQVNSPVCQEEFAFEAFLGAVEDALLLNLWEMKFYIGMRKRLGAF